MTGSGMFSARFDRRLIQRLEARARRVGQPRSRLVERYVAEGMRMDEHPGIVFRGGPGGRRAAVAGGPDVWEVMSVARNAPERGEAAAAHTAEWLSLSIVEVRAAVGYYGDFPEEIDERIRRHREEAEEAEGVWRRRQTALA